jgi:hydroxyacylglutathione hydrolase
MKKLLAFCLAIAATQAWCEPVPGSMDVRWNQGAADCEATPQPPLQVHAYEPRTFILRQNPCADFEANFLYLLVGSDKALLIDTGAVAEEARMPLARAVQALLPDAGSSEFPLLVVHSHGHGDHSAGDPQFAGLPSVQVVPRELEAVRTFFGLAEWPDGVARLDLGDRIVEVVPVPGHHPSHVAFYDSRTAIVFSGDFLLPGRLLVDDIDAYRASASRLAGFVQARPVTHVLGSHIELDAAGSAYPMGSRHHPDERPLQLTKADLLALPAALASFNGFYTRDANFIISNPIHNLVALAALALAVLVLLAWGVRRLVLRRRRKRAEGR